MSDLLPGEFAPESGIVIIGGTPSFSNGLKALASEALSFLPVPYIADQLIRSTPVPEVTDPSIAEIIGSVVLGSALIAGLGTLILSGMRRYYQEHPGYIYFNRNPYGSEDPGIDPTATKTE